MRVLFYILFWGRTRRRLAGQIMSAMMANPNTRIDGEIPNYDIHLPELAQVALDAADAIIVASRLPPNEALAKT